MSGGLVRFTVSKDGKAINDDKVMDLPNYVTEALYEAIYAHFGTHGPADASFYQVEVDDSNGGPLIDFSTKGKAGAFSLPELTVTLKGKVYTVSFEEFEPNNNNNNNNNNNSNMNGGKRRRNTRRQRSRRAHRRNTRRQRR